MENGEIDHKTEVIVRSQELEHQGYGNYSGYLTVEEIENGKQYVIDVQNFITKPYWEYSDLEMAARTGYYIAEYNQISDYYPVTRDGKKTELNDGILVLVKGPTGTYGRGGADRKTNQVEAIVYKQWEYGYGGVSVFFNVDDLKMIY